MLQLDVVVEESYDDLQQEFVMKTHTLELEHSLLSLSKWESKYEKPFLNQKEKSADEVVDYVLMMNLGGEIPPEVLSSFTAADFEKINAYINSKQTATWFSKKDQPHKRNTQSVTAELIYYWITSYEIPWVVETWHINRLFTLIEVFNEERGAKDSKANKAAPGGIAEQRRKLNEERKAMLATSG